jgi:hypothetical protein
MKFNALLTNAVFFHSALDIAEIVRQLLEEGWEIDPEDLAHISPYLTEHMHPAGPARQGQRRIRAHRLPLPARRARTCRRDPQGLASSLAGLGEKHLGYGGDDPA